MKFRHFDKVQDLLSHAASSDRDLLHGGHDLEAAHARVVDVLHPPHGGQLVVLSRRQLGLFGQRTLNLHRLYIGNLLPVQFVQAHPQCILPVSVHGHVALRSIHLPEVRKLLSVLLGFFGDATKYPCFAFGPVLVI